LNLSGKTRNNQSLTIKFYKNGRYPYLEYTPAGQYKPPGWRN
jgi:hypothetical protein